VRPRPRERPRSLRRKDRGAWLAPRTQLLEGQAVERRHISKRHSDKAGDHLRGSAWMQSGRLASARDILRPGGAHPASRNATASPHATSQ